MKIPINRITITKRQKCDTNFVALRESILNHGLRNPVVVQQLPGGRYRLVDGIARLGAYKDLGHSEIEARIL